MGTNEEVTISLNKSDKFTKEITIITFQRAFHNHIGILKETTQITIN